MSITSYVPSRLLMPQQNSSVQDVGLHSNAEVRQGTPCTRAFAAAEQHFKVRGFALIMFKWIVFSSYLLNSFEYVWCSQVIYFLLFFLTLTCNWNLLSEDALICP